VTDLAESKAGRCRLWYERACKVAVEEKLKRAAAISSKIKSTTNSAVVEEGLN
jgi:L-2-hydroxyglutarate oxidase LhgO